MAFAAQRPKRWSHSYSGRAGLISHSREGRHGSPFLYLGVKKETQEQKGTENEVEEENTEGRRGKIRKRKDAQLEMSREPRLPFSFSPLPPPTLPILCFQAPPTPPSSSIHSAQNPEMPPLSLYHLSLWQIHNWPAVIRWQKFWQDTEQCGRLQQIKLLWKRWETIRWMDPEFREPVFKQDPNSPSAASSCTFPPRLGFFLFAMCRGKPVPALYPAKIYWC